MTFVKDLLIKYGASGAVYTTMRSIDKGRRLVEFDQHCQRLVTSGNGKGITIPNNLKDSVIKAIKKATPPSINFQNNKEYRITVILTKDSEFIALWEELPIQPESVKVQIKKLTRNDPGIKSTQWVLDRQILEASMDPTCNEVILCDEEGRLYEGLSSNFVVIHKNGDLMTAPKESVLPGTLLKLVEDSCQTLNIGMSYDFPLIRDLQLYGGAFICSTSRGVLPINEIITEYGKRSHKPINNEIMQKLQESVSKMQFERSVPI